MTEIEVTTPNDVNEAMAILREAFEMLMDTEKQNKIHVDNIMELKKKMDLNERYEKLEIALTQKTLKIADLEKKLSDEQAVSQKLKRQIVQERNKYEQGKLNIMQLEKKILDHMTNIIELQKTILDLNERHAIEIKLKEAAETKTKLTMLQNEIIEKQNEAKKLQEELYNSSNLNENSFGDGNSSKSGTTIYYIFYYFIVGSLNILEFPSAFGMIVAKVSLKKSPTLKYLCSLGNNKINESYKSHTTSINI